MELYQQVKDAIGPEPIKMQALAHAIGLTKKGEAVPSSAAASIRVRTKRLEAEGIIIITGARATTKYVQAPAGAKLKPAKVKATKPKAAKAKAKAKPTKAPKKRSKAKAKKKVKKK